MSHARMLAVSAALFCLAAPLWAATEPAPLAQPEFPSHEVLARTPVVDGVADAGEGTPVYSIKTGSGEVKVGAAWDSSYLYLLLDGPALAKSVLYLDSQADGWLNGADNFQIDITPSAGGVAFQTKMYNSFISSPSRALAPFVLDIKGASRTEGGRSVVEMQIPRDESCGLDLKADKKLAAGVGATLASEPGRVWPADPRASMQTLTLKDLIAASIDGLDLNMKVKDHKVVPGQTLSVDFYADNHTEATLAYKSFEIGGEANVKDLLNSLRVRGDTIQPGKRVKWGFSTDLPKDMAVGTFALGVKMELADGRVARLLSSFEVVDIIDASLDLGTGPVIPGEERELAVVITNNRPNSSGGSVQLILPEALQRSVDRVKGKFLVRTEDSQARVGFKLKPGADVAPGEYRIQADVESGTYKRTLTGTVLVGKAKQAEAEKGK